eukprot:4697521-Alexandrium_andersonii.AAC.1
MYGPLRALRNWGKQTRGALHGGGSSQSAQRAKSEHATMPPVVCLSSGHCCKAALSSHLQKTWQSGFRG